MSELQATQYKEKIEQGLITIDDLNAVHKVEYDELTYILFMDDSILIIHKRADICAVIPPQIAATLLMLLIKEIVRKIP